MTRIVKKQKPNIEECVQNTTNNSSIDRMKFFETITDVALLPIGGKMIIGTLFGYVGGWVGLVTGLACCLYRIRERYHTGQAGVHEGAATKISSTGKITLHMRIPVTSVQQMFLADQNGRVPRSVQGMAAASSGDMESWSYRELVERLSMLVENDDPESEDGFSPDALEVVDIIMRRFGPASKTEGEQHAK